MKYKTNSLIKVLDQTHLHLPIKYTFSPITLFVYQKKTVSWLKIHTMNKTILLIALFFGLQSCDFFVSPDRPPDNKKQIAQINKNGTFSSVLVSGAADVVIQKGLKHKIELKGNPDHFNYLQIELTGDKLTCATRSHSPASLNVQVYITTPNIEAIKLSGASEIEMRDFGQLQSLDIVLSGAGSYTMTGKKTTVKDLAYFISGAGSINAENVIGENVKIGVSGAGSADITATKTLDASVSGVGSIVYRGNAHVKKQVSGIGSIRKK